MRTRSRQGFTLVEVMVSLGIMVIAGMAIVALQQQITRGNTHARQITIATQIAQNVIERLKLDALRWVALGNLTATQYLRDIPAPGGDPNGFTSIPPLTAGARVLSRAFDYYGDDLDIAAGRPDNLFYCASHRLNWVFNNQRVIRADVRVWWAREGEGQILADYPLCEDDDNTLNPGGANFDRYHVVYLSTVLRGTP